MKTIISRKTVEGALILAILTPNSTLGVDWTPTEISTALWFDAADPTTITSDVDGVSLWADKSGNGRDAVQVSATSKPDTGIMHHGLNVINFDGSSEFFDLGTGLDWLAGVGNATHTTFAVLNVSTFSNLYGAATPAGANDARLHVGFRSANDYRINRWANDYYPPTTNFIQNEFNIVQWSWVEGGPKAVYANARLEGSGGAGGGTGSSLQAMSGGGRIGSVVNQGFLGADIGEIIIVAGTPDEDTTDRIEGYLAWKWGEQDILPVDHPYKDGAPQVGGGAGSLKITAVSFSADSSEVTLTWDSVENESYLIRFSSDLSDWSGTIPGGAVVAPGAETTKVVDLADAGLGDRETLFFRVELE